MLNHDITEKEFPDRKQQESITVITPDELRKELIPGKFVFNRDLYKENPSLKRITMTLPIYLAFKKKVYYYSAHPTDYFMHHRYTVTFVPTRIDVCKKADVDKLNYSGIVIPGDTLSIPPFAFSGCKNLVYAVIPEWVQKMGAHAFEKCEYLPEITIPNSVETLEEGTFEGCRRLYKVTLGTGIRAVGESAFAGCRSLDGIVLPPETEKIGKHAFAGCKKLQKIVIPDSVKQIADTAFLDCHPYRLCIHCHKGSSAEQFAKKHKINIQYL